MNGRFRFLAALLALVAFSAYFAEGVLAAFCAPESPQHAEVAMDTSHASAGHLHGAPAPEAPAEGPHQSQCPFGMGGGMTCVAASLPGTATAVQPSPASVEGTFIPQQVSIALLLVHSLYHPPRA
jgi:hypothetical protein